MVENGLPPTGFIRDDGIAGMRRSVFDRVGKRLAILKGRQADTARIDDQPPVIQPKTARDMGVAAQDQRGIGVGSAQRDLIGAGGPDALCRHGFHEIEQIAAGRAMDQQHIIGQPHGRGKAGEPVQIIGPQDMARMAIRQAHAAHIGFQHLPFVIAADRRQVERHQPVRGLGRP